MKLFTSTLTWLSDAKPEPITRAEFKRIYPDFLLN